MDENQIIIYDAPKVQIKENGDDYLVTIGQVPITLKRDVDFGMIYRKDGSAITTKPTLFKSGAHRILTQFGLAYISRVVDSYKLHDTGYFYYEVETTAYYKGQPVRSGLGCANTKESANGNALGFNTANSMLKKAEKRSEVDLAIKLADASGWFVADLEDTENEKKAARVLSNDDEITTKQRNKIFALAKDYDITKEKAKELLKLWFGFESTKEIKQKDYRNVLDKLEEYGKQQKGMV